MPDKLVLLVIARAVAGSSLPDALAAEPGIERHQADSLAEAAPAITAVRPDVVLLDLDLPDARGLEAIDWLQRHHPDLPIVALAGAGADDPLVAGEAVRLGAQDVLDKGRIPPGRLARTLELAQIRKARERRALATALHDPLTDLPRLPILMERFWRSGARGQRNRSHAALLRLEVEGFAAFARTAGAGRTQRLLVAITHRLVRRMRRTDTLARLDGAGFAMLADGMRRAADAQVVARTLLSAMRRPFAGFEGPAPFGLSIGVAPCRTTGDSFADRLAAAEAAMREARRRGGRCHVMADAADLATGGGA